MYGFEAHPKDVLREWDHAVEIFQDFRDEVEEAIERYGEIQRLYDEACYDLRDAEERINKLEAEIQKLRTKMQPEA